MLFNAAKTIFIYKTINWYHIIWANFFIQTTVIGEISNLKSSNIWEMFPKGGTMGQSM